MCSNWKYTTHLVPLIRVALAIPVSCPQVSPTVKRSLSPKVACSTLEIGMEHRPLLTTFIRIFLIMSITSMETANALINPEVHHSNSGAAILRWIGCSLKVEHMADPIIVFPSELLKIDSNHWAHLARYSSRSGLSGFSQALTTGAVFIRVWLTTESMIIRISRFSFAWVVHPPCTWK